jgi:hypothetical protein
MKTYTLRVDSNLVQAINDYKKENYINSDNTALTLLVVDALKREALDRGGVWPVVKGKK